MKLLFPSLWLPCILAFGGCAISHATRVPGANYPPTDPRGVELLYQEPARAYEVVGFVAVDVGAGVTGPSVQRKFRTAGSELGAEAVVVEALPVHGFITTVQGKGKAIRWKR